MSKKSDAEVIHEVSERIDIAIKQNHAQERIIVALLVALFVAGLGLIFYGAVIKSWHLLAPGSILQLAIVFPIRRLRN